MDEEFLRDLFGRLGSLSVRRMFGGQGVYADGAIFAVVINDRLWIKADAETVPRFEAEGSRPFRYQQGDRTVAMAYWSLPEAALDDPDLALEYGRLGLAASLRTKRPAKRKPAAVQSPRTLFPDP